MTPEQAKMMADFFVSVIEHETQINMTILKAVPEEKNSYRPAKLSRSGLELSRHIPVVDLWFLDAVANGQFAPPDGDAESGITSVAQAIRLYEEKLPAAIDRVKALSGEQLAKEMTLMEMFTQPAVIFLSFMIRHTVHHRGQLSAYLRPMGAKVPRIYGGSADEPMEVAASG